MPTSSTKPCIMRASLFPIFSSSLLSLFAGVLNATGRFLAAAFAPVLLNLVLIGAALLSLMTSGAPLDYLIWGVSLAGLVQFVLVVVAARRAGLRVPLRAPRIDPDTGRFFTLVVPGILAAGIGQINLLIGTSIATGQAGAAAGFIMPTVFTNCRWGLSAWHSPSRFCPI